MAVDVTINQTGLITGEELAQLGNLGRCELIDGRIVPMSPTGYEHGEIENAIGTELRTFARSHHLGKVLVGEVGIYTRRALGLLSSLTYARSQRLSGPALAPQKGLKGSAACQTPLFV